MGRRRNRNRRSNKPKPSKSSHSMVLNPAKEATVREIKYKKSTIAFLAAFLNHFHIKNSLSEYLSPVSSYKIPNLEALYESAQ